jgi:hypothetical protein
MPPVAQDESLVTLLSPLGRRVSVFWPTERDWYRGIVQLVDDKGRAFVVYDDGDEGWEDLRESKRWEFDDRRHGPSFWSLGLAERLEAVYMVIHERSVEDVGHAQRRQKEEMDRVKKEINEEKERHKQRFIAELISSQQICNISAEKQQEIVANARQIASSAVSEETKARLRWLKTSQFLKNCAGRTVAVGEDRTGLSYFSLGCAKLVTGSSQGLICMAEDSVSCFGGGDAKRVVEALDAAGEKEGALRMGLEFINSLQ